RRRPDLVLVPRGARAVPFGGEPEEGPVLDDRAAEAAAVQAVIRVGEPVLLLRDAGLVGEVVLRLAPDGARLVETAAVKIVRPRARGDVEHAAADPAHLGVVRVHL